MTFERGPQNVATGVNFSYRSKSLFEVTGNSSVNRAPTESLSPMGSGEDQHLTQVSGQGLGSDEDKGRDPSPSSLVWL